MASTLEGASATAAHPPSASESHKSTCRTRAMRSSDTVTMWSPSGLKVTRLTPAAGLGST